MELIDYLVQIKSDEERVVKRSAVHLIVNQEGEEIISINHDYVVLYNCSIRNIMPDGNSDVWHHYFKIYKDDGENGIVVKSKLQTPFKLTKVKD